MNVVEVYFDNTRTSSFFRNNDLKVKVNFTVLVNTDRGIMFGKVINIFDDISQFGDLNLYDVIKITSKKDYYHYLENLKMAKVALSKCRDIVEKSDVNMSILDANYNFDRSQLLFRFVADERVDFRKLAKVLGSTFKTRIELRQIGIRDKAKEIGGIGPCGRLLCCSSFFTSFDSVTISMAKNQNVSLNPSKINGVCGRLLCCLKYENDIYFDMKKELPKIGSMVKIPQGSGKVISINLFKKSYIVELDEKNRVEVIASDDRKK